MSKIDLHMHSAFSLDADLPVEILIDRCLANQVSILAVTDHNSVHSVNVARQYTQNKDVTVLSGIEIDCSFQGGNYHLLGYGFKGDMADFHNLEKHITKLQADVVPVKLQKLKDLGFHLDEDHLYQLAKGNTPQEEQMAELILEDERNFSHPLLSIYRGEGARADMPLINFYWDFFGAGKPCHTPVAYPALTDMVSLIKSNHGIPVIAHIGANVKTDHLKVLDEMKAVGVMGVEVFSSYHNAELANKLYDYALGNDLFVTCGSDFHGKNKPKIEVGTCNYDAVTEQYIKRFVESALA
ncbi:MAG: PHP domain-containing protein [Gammaproteobacteria bacterium]|nr:PHP domain-containing protein [Gammaproteobacteria bacterium]